MNKIQILKLQISLFRHICERDPGDYLSRFELEELRQALKKQRQIKKLGLTVVVDHLSNPDTGEVPQAS